MVGLVVLDAFIKVFLSERFTAELLSIFPLLASVARAPSATKWVVTPTSGATQAERFKSISSERNRRSINHPNWRGLERPALQTATVVCSLQ
ncbi:hypothetical protein AWB69_03872 [Caballeronia udeis]|uniref:Uncharacterized protein n=1 Tax=Caballeronia udeis TaxID=1232866 RepID=A0A158H4K5_9BURK|nr:hypothetical protein AWB69_03872 [Caballeronia udeis]